MGIQGLGIWGLGARGKVKHLNNFKNLKNNIKTRIQTLGFFKILKILRTSWQAKSLKSFKKNTGFLLKDF